MHDLLSQFRKVSISAGINLCHHMKLILFIITRFSVSELPIFLLVPNQGQDRDGICRSWGQHHYETFDGIYFFFPGTCSYVLAQDCHSATPQYTVWVRAYRSKLK